MQLTKILGQLIDVLAGFLLGLVLFFSLGGFLADYHWRLAWYSNPRPQFALAALIALAWFLFRQKQWLAGLATLTLLINLFVLAPFFIPLPKESTSTQTLSIAHFNTNRGQADLAALNYLQTDIILLQEFVPADVAKLPQIFADYQVVYSHPLENTHGSAVLRRKDSPLEVLDSQIIHLPDYTTRPLIESKFRFDEQILYLLNLHVILPHHQGADRFQKVELEAVADWSAMIQTKHQAQVLVIGDFNVTPWAQRFYRLLETGHLQDSLRGFGLQNTWPGALPQALGIPIDHALHSSGLVTVDRATRKIAGSDHALLTASFKLKE